MFILSGGKASATADVLALEFAIGLGNGGS